MAHDKFLKASSGKGMMQPTEDQKVNQQLSNVKIPQHPKTITNMT